MKGMNRATLIGFVGNVYEYRVTATGHGVINFSLCTPENYTRRDGEEVNRDEWHRCVAYGKLADVVRDWIDKGSKLCIEGQIQTNRWTGKDGTEHKDREIRVIDLYMLGDGRNRQGGGNTNTPASDSEVPDDNIPF